MTIEEVRKLFKGNPGYLEKDEKGWCYIYDEHEYGYEDSTYVCTTLNDVTDNCEPVGTVYSCKD